MNLKEWLGERDYVRGEEIRARLEPGETLRGVEFEDCTFVGCVFDEGVLRSCQFTDCRFTSCSLSLTKLPGTEFDGVRFVDCKALSVGWTEIRPNQVSVSPLSFEGCKLDYSAFVRVDLRRWHFARCSLVEAEFGDATLAGVTLTECDLAGARFVGTDLRKADLTSSVSYALDVRDNQVAGLKVSAEGAAGLLRAFGVEVDWG